MHKEASMTQIKKKWRIISLGYLLLSYIVIVVVLKNPLSMYLINAALYLLLLILVFLGTFVGFVGLLVHMATKKESAALPLYSLSHKLNTDNPTILSSYGLILLRNNEAPKALTCFEKAFEKSSNYMTTKTVMSNIAICYWKLGDLDKAIGQYHKIIKRFGNEDQIFLTDPNYNEEHIDQFITDNHLFYPQDYITLGFLYTLEGDYEKANFFTRAAMVKKEDYAAAYDNLGQIEYYQENYDKATEYFEKALDINPNMPDSLYFMGLVNIKQDNKKEALAFLTKAEACTLDGLNTFTYEMIEEAKKTIK